MTVLGNQIAPASNSALARAPCCGSSSTKSRTITLVSTAITTLLDLISDGLVHFVDGPGTPTGFPETPGDLLESGYPRLDRTEQHPVRPLLDDELRPRPPPPGIPHRLRQDDLPFGRKLRRLHVTCS